MFSPLVHFQTWIFSLSTKDRWCHSNFTIWEFKLSNLRLLLHEFAISLFLCFTTLRFQLNKFKILPFQLHEFTRISSKFNFTNCRHVINKKWINNGENFSHYIYDIEIVNSRSWDREFIKSKYLNCEFTKLKWWIHEV